jgi:hypothetical protein
MERCLVKLENPVEKMIPREILKKIRQVEIRANRVVTGFAERGCVRSTSRSTPDISYALTNHHALRLGLRPQPRSNSCRAQGLEFRVYAARFASVPIRLKAELQTVTIVRCPSRITHHASRHP